jgi:hypothetical protein
MNTSELIKELQRLDPTGTAEVEIPVRVYTRAYPVAYLKPFQVENMNGTVRIGVSFPEGYSVSKRRAA